MNEPLSFGSWLKQRRKSLDLTQDELARQSTCSLGTVRKIESDDLLPSKQLAQQLATTLHVPENEREAFVRFARAGTETDTQPPLAQPSKAANTPMPMTWHVAAPLAPAPAFAPTAPPRLTNLPKPLTVLIGRDQEINEVSTLLRASDCSLVTLVGPGGMGKTRLALAVASEQQADFADGVYFVALASLAAAEFIVPAIAMALNLSLTGTLNPKSQLLNYLADKQMLLVLDNFEHLLEGVALLVDLGERAAKVKLLVTSRERLDLQAEWVFDLAGLAIPPPPSTETPVKQYGQVNNRFHTDEPVWLEVYPSMALFAASARRVQHGFALTVQNQPALAQICCLVGGMPLAIELAASWVHLLPCEEIAKQIEHNLDFLTVTRRDMPARHRSLRAAFDHSWKLLTPEEQRLLCQLSVFQGGFTLESAQQVTGATLIALSDLVTKSLVQRPLEERYTLHELIHQYVAFALATDAALQSATIARHAAYFLDFVQHANASLAGKEWLLCLQIEHDNCRASLQRFVDGRGVESEVGLGLVEALSRFWYRASHWHEGRRWFEAALQRGHDASDLARANMLRGLARFLVNQGEWKQALGYAQQSLALLRKPPLRKPALQKEELAKKITEPGVDASLAHTLYVLGYVLGKEREYALAQTYLEEGLALSSTSNTGGADSGGANSDSITLRLLIALGDLMSEQGKTSQANDYYTKSIALSEQIGERVYLSSAYNGLGELARLADDYPSAIRHFEESLRLTQLTGSTNVASRTHNLAYAVLHAGDLQRATQLFGHSLHLSQTLGDKLLVLQCLAGFAGLAIQSNQLSHAAQLGGAVQQLLADNQLQFDRTDQLDFEQTLRALHSQLDAPRFALNWTEGQAMTVSQAVTLAVVVV